MHNCNYYHSTLLALFLCLSYAVNCQDKISNDFPGNNVLAEHIENRLDSAMELKNANINKSLELARSALKEALILGDELLIAESKLTVGEIYDYLGVNAEATKYLTEALETFNKLSLREKSIRASKLIGNTYWYLGESELALTYFNDLIAYAKEVKDTELLTNGLNSSGSAYGLLGRFDTAYYLFDTAYKLSLLDGNELNQVHSLLYLGYASYNMGKPAEALEFFKKIERQYNVEELSTMLLTNLYQQLAFTYYKLGDLTKASDYSEKEYKALLKYPRLNQWEQHYHFRFKLDSANHDFLSAIKNYQMYKELYDSSQSGKFKQQMANYEIQYQLNEKESQIDQLKLDNKLKDLILSKRRIISLGSYLVILLLMVVVVQSLRIRSREKRRNRELALANDQTSEHRKKLAEKNEELELTIKELKATQQHLVQSEKMASLGVLTAGVAHEINNPLNYISGGVGIIEDYLQGTNDKLPEATLNIFSESLGIISEGVERTANIVKSLMTFSYRGMPKLVLYNLTHLIDNTLVFMHSKLSDDIAVRKIYDFNEQSLIYPDKLHQVLLNIIDNAIFAIKDSGKEEKEIIITTKKEKNQIFIHIQDNGTGIPDKHLPNLFDPFFTTKDPGEGTGLGLSISYNLVQEQGGVLEVKNTHPGSRFTIKLPYKR